MCLLIYLSTFYFPNWEMNSPSDVSLHRARVLAFVNDKKEQIIRRIHGIGNYVGISRYLIMKGVCIGRYL